MTTDPDLTEAVDAAAQALRCSWSPPEPEHPDEQACRMQGMCVDQAARVVEAAAPLIAAQVRAETLRPILALADEWQAMSEVEHPMPGDDLDVARVTAVSVALEECALELRRLAASAVPTEEAGRG